LHCGEMMKRAPRRCGSPPAAGRRRNRHDRDRRRVHGGAFGISAHAVADA
jgi:hypothetical protein